MSRQKLFGCWCHLGSDPFRNSGHSRESGNDCHLQRPCLANDTSATVCDVMPQSAGAAIDAGAHGPSANGHRYQRDTAPSKSGSAARAKTSTAIPSARVAPLHGFRCLHQGMGNYCMIKRCGFMLSVNSTAASERTSGAEREETEGIPALGRSCKATLGRSDLLTGNV